MKIIFTFTAILIGIVFTVLKYRNSRYNRLENLPNTILIIGLGIALNFMPMCQKSLHLNKTNESLTISQSGNIGVQAIDGVNTSNYLVTVDRDYSYPNVTLTDGTYEAAFASFSFAGDINTTYELHYDSASDSFYTYRDLNRAHGISIISLLIVFILIINLILIIFRSLQSHKNLKQTNRFKMLPLQRLVNTIDRGFAFLFIVLVVWYFANLFGFDIVSIIDRLNDTQYIFFALGVVIVPVIFSFVIELLTKEYAIEIGEDYLRLYDGSQEVFVGRNDSFTFTENFIRNTRTYTKDYLAMNVTFNDSSHQYEGITLDLKRYGTEAAFDLVARLRDFIKEPLPKSQIDDNTKEEQENKTFTLVGFKQDSKATRGIVFGFIISVVLMIFVPTIVETLNIEISSTFLIIMIILFAIIPFVFIVLYLIGIKRNSGILPAVFNESTLTFNEDVYPIDSDLEIRMAYPDTLVARNALIRITSHGTKYQYMIRRDGKMSQDEYYKLFTYISVNHPNLLKIK